MSHTLAKQPSTKGLTNKRLWVKQARILTCKVVQVLAICLLSPKMGRTSYLEQDDHGEEHVEAPKSKGKALWICSVLPVSYSVKTPAQQSIRLRGSEFPVL